MTVLMKYPTGRTGAQENNEGEIHSNGDSLYIEECDGGGFFRIYGAEAIKFLESKEVDNYQQALIDEAINLLKSKTNVK